MELQHSSETQHVDKGHQTTVDIEVTELEYNFDKDIILNSGLKLIAIQLEYQSGGSGHIESTVEDKGEGPGEPGSPPIFLDQTEARRDEHCFFWRPPPSHLRVWMTAPPPYLKIWIRHSSIWPSG